MNAILMAELEQYPEDLKCWSVFNDGDHIESFGTLQSAVNFMMDRYRFQRL